MSVATSFRKNSLSSISTTPHSTSRTESTTANSKKKNSNIFDSLFPNASKSSTSSPAAAGAAASCCVGPSLSELAKVLDGSSSIGKSMENMDMSNMPSHGHSSNNTMSGITGYIAGAASISAFITAAKNHKQGNMIKEALEKIKDIRKNNPESELSEDLKAFEKYFQTMLTDVSFVKTVPGIMSGIASALIGIGAILPFILTSIAPSLVSIVGLCIGVVDGCLHIIKTVQLMFRHQKQIENINADNDLPPEKKEILVNALNKEWWLCFKRCIGAILTVIGVTLLVIAYLSMNHFIVLAELAMTAIMITGIACLLPAIYLSIRYSPYQDLSLRKKFLDSINEANINSDKLINNLKITKAELLSKIEKACKDQNFSLQYKDINQLGTIKKLIKKILNWITLACPQILTYATFNLLPGLNTLNRKAKETVADSLYETFNWSDRIEFLWSINGNNPDPEEINKEELNPLSKEAEEELFFSELKMNVKNEGGEELDGKILGGVLRLAAVQSLNYNKNENQSSLCGPYKKIFDRKNFSNLSDEEYNEGINKIINVLSILLAIAPCCEPIANSDYLQDIEDILDKAGKKDESDETNQSLKEKLKKDFRKNLVGRFDQYAIFSTPNLSESDLRVYSRMFSAFYSPEEKTADRIMRGRSRSEDPSRYAARV